jgi:hypothetical protein
LGLPEAMSTPNRLFGRNSTQARSVTAAAHNTGATETHARTHAHKPVGVFTWASMA